MVFRGVVEVLELIQSLVAIATGDRIADEFDLSRREGGSLNELTTLVKYETPELRKELITLNDVHQMDKMTSLGQGGGEGDDRVALPTECHLKGFSLVDLCHEVAALGLSHHP